MKLTSFLCSKSWTSRRARTLCSVAGVALGIGLVVAVLTVDRNAVLHQKARAMRDYGRPHLEVGKDWGEAAEIGAARAAVAALPEVAQVMPIASARARFAFGGEDFDLRWIAVPLEAQAAFEAFKAAPGTRLEVPEDASAPVWVTRKLRREQGLEVGRELTFGGRTRRIAGLIQGERMAALDDGEVILTPWSAAHAAADGTWQGTRLWVRLHDVARRDAVLERLTGMGYLAQPPAFEQISATAEDIAMRNGLKICALLSMFLGLFIVFHTLLMTVAERRNEISLLHALGATRRQIGAAFLGESLMQAVCGAAAGLLLGVVLSWLMGLVGISSMGASRFAIREVPWREAFAVAVGGVVLTLLGALYPVFMTARVPTAQVLYPSGIPLEDLRASPVRWLLPLLFGLALLVGQVRLGWIVDPGAELLATTALRIAGLLAGFVSLMFVMPSVIRGVAGLFGRLVPLLGGKRYYLAYRNVSASGHRNTTAVCALAMVFAGIFCMHTLTESLKDEIRTWAGAAVRGRMFYETLTAPKPVDKAPFQQLDGVTAVLAVENEVRVPFVIRGIDFTDLLPLVPAADREALAALSRGEGVLVTRALAAQRGWREGQDVELTTREGRRRFPILQIQDAYGYQRPERAYMLMAPGTLQQAFGARAGLTGSYILHLAKDAPVRDLQEHLLRDAYKGKPRARSGTWLFRNRVRNIDRDFLVFDVVLLGAVALAGLSMINSLMIRARERRREIALYRALGMTPVQLVRGLTAEGLILGITGSVLALVLGLPCGYLGFVALREVSGLNLEYAVPAGWVIACTLLCLLVALIASRYPARHLARDDVAGSLQYS